MDDVVARGIISSIDQVRAEVEKYKGEQVHLIEWMERHADIFTQPTEFEQKKIVHVEEKFGQEVVFKMHSNRMAGRIQTDSPSADVLIIAKAWAYKGTVVTCERRQKFPIQKGQKNIRIPQICRGLGVECVNFHEFMSEMGWRFISAPSDISKKNNAG